MIFYGFLIGTAAIFAFLEMAKPADALLKRRMLALASISAVLLTGFREGVGGDWGAYLCYHGRAGYTPFLTYIQFNDPGYMSAGWVFARLGLGVWATNLFCAVILISGITRLASVVRYSNMFFLSAVPYLIIVVGMGYSRQSAAIGLVCHAIVFLLKDRRPATMMTAAAALFFHKSAAFGIAPIMLTFGKRFWLRALILALLAPIVAAFVMLEGYEIARRGYLEAEYQSSGALIRVLQVFMLGCGFLIFFRRWDESARIDIFFISAILAILSLPAVILSPSSTLVDRLVLYLLPFQCYVLARLPEGFRAGPSRIFVQSGVIMINLAIFGVWMTSAAHLDSWINYSSYLWSGSSLWFQPVSC